MPNALLGSIGLVAATVCSGLAIAQATPTAKDTGVVTVVEYYNATMDHYFMTSLPGEIALCDAGQAPCAGWARTGESFRTWAPGTADQPGNTLDAKVCRLFNDTFAGKSTHFYALQGEGCEETLADFPGWQLETSELFDADYANGPGSGNCISAFYSPLYRLYNNGMGGAPNHRFTKDYRIVQDMVSKGWTPEGDGLGVVMCIPNVS